MASWDDAAAAASSDVDVNRLALAAKHIVQARLSPPRMLRNAATVRRLFEDAGMQFYMYRSIPLVRLVPPLITSISH